MVTKQTSYKTYIRTTSRLPGCEKPLWLFYIPSSMTLASCFQLPFPFIRKPPPMRHLTYLLKKGRKVSPIDPCVTVGQLYCKLAFHKWMLNSKRLIKNQTCS